MKKHDDKVVSKNEDKSEEWKNKYLRALADYQNLERRSNEFRQTVKEQSVEEVMHSVLLFLDLVEKAQKHLNDSGLALAIKSFDATLAYYHIKKIEVLHKSFDPIEMECVDIAEVDEEKDNIVLEEVRPGFKIGNKVLRVAQVKVGKSRNRVTNIPLPDNDIN